MIIKMGGCAVNPKSELSWPDPKENPASPLMLHCPQLDGDPFQFDFSTLPKVTVEHSTVSDVRYAWGRKVNQHNYLVYHDNRFWAMWSDGPGLPRDADAAAHRNITPGHDQPGQLISYSTSPDGVRWSEPRDVAGPPDDGFGWIARGFWLRQGKLLALAARYQAPGYTGDGLQLHCFVCEPNGERLWRYGGLVKDNSINNFPPKQLPDGRWLMSRRDKEGRVSMLVGGAEAYDQWDVVDIHYDTGSVAAEEPCWWVLPDNHLAALFRDNNRSGFLFRSFSADNGRTWTQPAPTNFPDARSKFFGFRLSDGRYVLISNSNPNQRDPLTIAVSDDGLVFHSLGYLVGGRIVDYPHAIEHDGSIYVTFCSAKQSVEVLKIEIAALDVLRVGNAR